MYTGWDCKTNEERREALPRPMKEFKNQGIKKIIRKQSKAEAKGTVQENKRVGLTATTR